MRAGSFEPSPVAGNPDRDRNQRTVIAEYPLQRPFGRNNDLTVDLSQRPHALSPPPFNAAMKAPQVRNIH
jgi:hypothetical protein